MSSILILIANALFVVQVLLVVYFITSFFPLNTGGFVSQVRGILGQLFEPILLFLRRYIPSIGMFDLSGLVLLIGLQLLHGILYTLAG